MDFVWILLMAGAFAAMAWWAYRADPHWVAKDGRAFTCKIQHFSGPNLQPEGRWRDGRAFIDGSHLVVRPRGLLTAGGKASAHYEVVRRGESVKNMAVYLVDGGGVNGHDFAALRIPAKSRAVPQLDQLLPQT